MTRFGFLLAFATVLFTSSIARAENRLAFVVGINAYPNLGADSQLQRAGNDAEAVGDTLQSLGFTVTRITKDATLNNILTRFGSFASTIAPGDTVVFFYAGHGISLDDGTYLVPGDVPALGPTDAMLARRTSVAEHDFTQQIRAAGARVALVVIDACRENPFPRRGTRAIGSATRGLTRLAPTEGVFTLYSAREGETALDRLSDDDPNKNSVFTRVFLESLRKPGVSLSELGEITRDNVAALALTVRHDQVPAVYNDMVGARAVYLAGKGTEASNTRLLQVEPSAPVQPTQKTPLQQQAMLTVGAPSGTAAASARDCDRFASNPLGKTGFSGVELNKIDTSLALPACRAALAADPNNPQLAYQLGRVMQRSGAFDEALRLYRQSADAGNANAVVNLGNLYNDGKGVAQDHVEAARLYRLGAEAGSAAGMYNLGNLYKWGQGVEKDVSEATRWHRKAAELGLAPAMYAVALASTDKAEAVSWYRKAAEAGHADAMTTLGYYYETGNGLPVDMLEAVRWYRKASEGGSSAGMRNLGIVYRDGKTVDRDYAEANRWFQKAIDAGSADALNSLGWMYQNGFGAEKNYSLALDLYRRGAEKGVTLAMHHLGVMYGSGQGVAKDEAESKRWYTKAAQLGLPEAMYSLAYTSTDKAESISWYRKAADAGYADAMTTLGFYYETGNGLPADIDEAVRWYRKAAAGGSSSGMRDLGIVYRDGKGVVRDYAEATRWFQKAVDAGSTDALNSLGWMYQYGLGTDKNYTQAFDLYQRGAQKGVSLAMHHLGVMYANGQGVAKDDAEAARWYRKSAEAGLADGMAALGWLYHVGTGVPADQAEAARLSRQAAGLGSSAGTNNLGVLFEMGAGVPRDKREAARLYRQAADLGNETAKSNLKRLGQRY